MHLTPGEDVLVADTAADFADAVVRLYRDQALWETLAAGGRENISRHFSREVARSAITRLIALADGYRTAGLTQSERATKATRRALNVD
jgi:glycosyltransferase involved in cell wall biosynthesis